MEIPKNVEQIKIGKLDLAVVKMKSFRSWLNDKMDIYDFQRLIPLEKRKLYLLYKFGLSETANEAAEENERYIIGQFKDTTDEEWYLKNKIEFNQKCDEEWKTIQDGSFFHSMYDNMKDIQREFEGKVV